MNESFKTDPSLATSARAAKESGSYLCASNVTPTAVRFIVSVFLCLLCSCRMSSTQMTCSHFRKNRPKKRQKPAGCRSRIISKNRPVPIFGRSTGASLDKMNNGSRTWIMELQGWIKHRSEFKQQTTFRYRNMLPCKCHCGTSRRTLGRYQQEEGPMWWAQWPERISQWWWR